MSKLFPILFVLIFIGFGVGFLGYGILQLVQASQTTEWPAVQGNVVECKLNSHTSDHKTTWKCDVRYAYNVDGQSFEGNRIAYGYNGTNNKSMHSWLHKKLNKSEYVRVYYNPSDPRESTLAVGIYRSAYLPIVFGGAWLGFCGGLFSLIFLQSPVKELPSRLARLNHHSFSAVR